MCGLDIKEHQLVSASRIIGNRLFNRVARVDQINKVHTFHSAPFGDVKAGDDAGFQHAISVAREQRQGQSPRHKAPDLKSRQRSHQLLSAQ